MNSLMGDDMGIAILIQLAKRIFVFTCFYEYGYGVMKFVSCQQLSLTFIMVVIIIPTYMPVIETLIQTLTFTCPTTLILSHIYEAAPPLDAQQIDKSDYLLEHWHSLTIHNYYIRLNIIFQFILAILLYIKILASNTVMNFIIVG